MHEFSTAQAIIETVLRAASESGATKVLRVSLEVGELTMLNLEQLRFSLKMLSKGTIAEGARFLIRRVKPEVKCLACGYAGRAKPLDSALHVPLAPVTSCPRCGSFEVEIIRGAECLVKSIRAVRG